MQSYFVSENLTEGRVLPLHRCGALPAQSLAHPGVGKLRLASALLVLVRQGRLGPTLSPPHTLFPKRDIMAREDDNEAEPLAPNGDSGVFRLHREPTDRFALLRRGSRSHNGQTNIS